MGGGTFDSNKYSSAKAHRLTSGVDDFEYSKRADRSTPIHANLDPTRIRNKPWKQLESRDSEEHPESNAIFIGFDVTGSNIANAIEAQKRLPNLMALLTKYVKDPQVLVAANDDYHVEGKRAFQISDFESDNRIDEHIRNILLTNNGGGNDGESYDLMMYAAANLTVLDCKEKRGRKGYFFMYADEPIFKTTSPEHANAIFGAGELSESVPIKTTIAKLKNLYHVFVLWPKGGYAHAYTQYIELFGKDCVYILQNPALICEMVASLVGMEEGYFDSEHKAEEDLVAAGVDKADAVAVSKLVWMTGKRKIKLQHPANA